jgi:hypothetical protein
MIFGRHAFARRVYDRIANVKGASSMSTRHGCKGAGICEWLKANKSLVQNYVVVEDYPECVPGVPREHICHVVDSKVGFSAENVEFVTRLFNA